MSPFTPGYGKKQVTKYQDPNIANTLIGFQLGKIFCCINLYFPGYSHMDFENEKTIFIQFMLR